MVTLVLSGRFVSAGDSLGFVGTFQKWSKVEIALMGPKFFGASHSRNPFKMDVTVNFISSSGQSYSVPAFYDGDGNGGMDGNVWKVRFSPDAIGEWTFHSISNHPTLHDYRGSFTVKPAREAAFGLAKWGRLEYVGSHYLKFRDGPYWLKGGADEPESLLGPGVLGDWESKRLAIDYLSRKGVNSLYILLQNVDGDGKNVWPWVSKRDSEHFDVAKLGDWENFFQYLQHNGIVLHLVFEDDSGWTGFNRGMYYREMIARFGHHNGLYWNISEEYGENYSPDEIRSFAQLIRDLDPYDHPLTVHNVGSLEAWIPFLGDPRFDLTSFQSNTDPQNFSTVVWRQKSRSAGRTLVVSHDETGQFRKSDRDKSRHMVWAVYLGGGMIELFTRNVAKLGFPAFEEFWDDMRFAREFVEGLPFWEMAPNNRLLRGVDGSAYCLAKPGQVYAGYLHRGGASFLDLSGQPGTYEVRWYDVKSGHFSGVSRISGGAVVALGTPGFPRDVAVLVSRIESQVGG